MLPVGSPAQPLALLEDQYSADRNAFATRHFKFRGEEIFCPNKRSPGFKSEHPKNGRKLALEGGGEGRTVTAWKSLAQRGGHGPCSTSEGAGLAARAYNLFVCSRSQHVPNASDTLTSTELIYSYFPLFHISGCPKTVTKFLFFH